MTRRSVWFCHRRGRRIGSARVVETQIWNGTRPLAFLGRWIPRRREWSQAGTAVVRLWLRETFNEEERFQLSEHAEVGNCWEAGRNRFWIPWFLEAIGVQSHVVASASMKVMWSRSPQAARAPGVRVAPNRDRVVRNGLKRCKKCLLRGAQPGREASSLPPIPPPLTHTKKVPPRKTLGHLVFRPFRASGGGGTRTPKGVSTRRISSAVPYQLGLRLQSCLHPGSLVDPFLLESNWESGRADDLRFSSGPSSFVGRTT